MEHVVVMAGGGGTRLWPVSRPDRPKQLMSLTGGRSLLAETVRRALLLAPRDRILVVTRRDQVEASLTSVPDLGRERFLAEPVGRNTAACIGLAAVFLRHRDPEAVLAVLPADHYILDAQGFAQVARDALARAAQGPIVTLGIRPDRPETGYGYIEMGDLVDEATGSHRAVRFVEKPDLATAQRYLDAGRFLWNSGMFFMRADRILAEMERSMPKLREALARLEAALGKGREIFDRALEEIYPGLESISIDYGVMEKVSDMEVIPADFGWNDVGSWAALPKILEGDGGGNVTVGRVVALDDTGCVIYNDEARPVAVVGMRDVIVVSSKAGVLVIPKDRAQEVRRVVAALEGGEP